MKRPSLRWLVLAVLFTLVNLGGGIYAGLRSEIPHASLHAMLALVGGWISWRLAVARGEPALAGAESPRGDQRPRELASRLARLEQSIDAIAGEVERVSEGQRVMTNRITQSGERKPDDG